MINYSDFPADSWNKTVDGSEVRKIIREEVRAEGERIVKSLVKAINSQSTVNAIPIEWIEELADKLKEDNFEKAMFLLDVRDVWEEEMEQRLIDADAVKVVRCKDCKYLDIINKAPVYACCSKHNHTFPLWEEDTREHFCAWGERKENEAN